MPHQKSCGLLIPAFTTRRSGDLGIGDTKGMKQFIDWAASSGIGFLQLLPINEMGVDESPYSAISSAALDPIFLTLDEDTIPWVEPRVFETARHQLQHAMQSPAVDYPSVRKAKRQILAMAWKDFGNANQNVRKRWKEFCQAEADWLADYCDFKLLIEFFGSHTPWDHWPAACQTADSARAFIAGQRKNDPRAVTSRLEYFSFVQWLCYEQWAEVRDHATTNHVKLMGDIPIGISWHSCDVFFHQDEFHRGWFGGTPPEGGGGPFLTRWGQNWGVPVYHWTHMEANGYLWWKQRIQCVTRFFQMFRLDHILGFYRIYAFPWHPRRNDEFADKTDEDAKTLTGGLLPRWWERPDDSPENKAFNRSLGDPRLRAIVEAAGEAEIIAEDLGWVPEYVRPHLAELGIAGYRIPHWDCDEFGHPAPGNRFPELSFASYSTHDHDPVGAIWRGCWNTLRTNRHSPGELPDWRVHDARNTLRILAEFGGIPIPRDDQWPEYGKTIQLRLLKTLLDSNARYAVIMVTELFDQDVRINEPGTSNQRNWSYRLPWTTEELNQSVQFSELSRILRTMIEVTGRAKAPAGTD